MKKVLSLVLLSLLVVSVLAGVPLPQKNTYVNDFAHLLTKKEVKALNKRLRAFENKTSIQMAVVLVNDLPPDYTIEDYATLIGRKWHVGTANNGLVYVAAIKQHKQRLEVAQKLQKYITDDRAEQVLDLLKIDLKYGLYYDAMKTLVDRTAVELADGKKEWTANEKNRVAEKFSADSLARVEALVEKNGDKTGSMIWYGILGILGVFLFGKLMLFFLPLVIPSLRKSKPTYNSYEDDGPETNVISYSTTRRTSSRPYQSSRRNYHTPLIHHSTSHVNLLAAEQQREEETRRNEERKREEDNRRREEKKQREEEDKRRENDERSYGNWGKNNNGSSGSSSSTSGFNGGGASSDW